MNAVNAVLSLQAHLGMERAVPGAAGAHKCRCWGGSEPGMVAQGHPSRGLLAPRSAHPELRLLLGRKSGSGRRSAAACFDRSRKLPGQTLSAHSGTAAQLIATSLARSHLISQASC